MSVRIVCRPLTRWPGQLRNVGQRRPSQFSANWTQTQELLEREARMIGGRELVIQLAVGDSSIRRDGWPYANAKPDHPGVTIVVPDSNHGRLSWSTDRYLTWQANTRAIALSMEALRAADRHGVMQGRQYAGFRELSAGDIDGDGRQAMSVEQAARFITTFSDFHDETWSGCIDQPPQMMLTPAYRQAARRLHPDAGGDPDAFRKLEQAKAVVAEHAGGTP